MFNLRVALLELDIAQDYILFAMDVGKIKYIVELAHKQVNRTHKKSACYFTSPPEPEDITKPDSSI